MSITPAACPFCEIWEEPNHPAIRHRAANTMVISPLDPVTPGHLLVIPREHVRDAIESAPITGVVYAEAARHVQRERDESAPGEPNLYDSVNLITSVGRPATQSVFHLHVHIVPRQTGDGLALPWFSGKPSKKEKR